MSLQFENLGIERRTRKENEETGNPSPQLEEFEVPEAVEDDVPSQQLESDEVAEDFLGDAAVPPTVMEERRNRIEAAIGESVRVSPAQAEHLASVMRDGVTCAVHITRERLQVKNSPEEFGVDPDLARELFGGMGVKYLAPKDILGDMNSADTMARNLLAKYGIKTPWGRFIPTRNWQAFKSAFTRQQTNYFNAANRLVEMMASGDHDRWIRGTYTDLAVDRWKHAKKNWQPDDGVDYTAMDTPPSEFVNLIVESALSRVPPPSMILANARFEYNLSVIQAPDTQLAVECATEDGDLNRELVMHMNDRKRSLIDDFLRAAREGLVEHVNGLVASVNKTLTGKSTVHGKTINRILRSIAEMRTLNITSDQDFEQRIAELEGYIQEKQASNGTVSSSEVLRNLRSTAERISSSMNRDTAPQGQFSNIGGGA